MIDDSKGKGKGRAETRESLCDSTDPTQSSRDAAGESSLDAYMLKYRHQQREPDEEIPLLKDQTAK